MYSGDMDDGDLKEHLGEEAYAVTQRGATERPFSGEFHDKKDDGMYHCVVCGAELFDSKTKFESGTGWPSFYDVAKSDAVILRPDDSLDMRRTEVVCKNCGAHLGHLFPDAIDTPTGNRYCINSCALSFGEREGE